MKGGQAAPEIRALVTRLKLYMTDAQCFWHNVYIIYASYKFMERR